MAQPSLIWTLGLVYAQHRIVTPPSKLIVVNACLGHELPPHEQGRGCLTLRVGFTGPPRSIASFSRGTCEQVNLDLLLEAGVQYIFSADGPFAIDLLGYHLNDERPKDSGVTGSSGGAASSSVMKTKTASTTIAVKEGEAEAVHKVVEKPPKKSGKRKAGSDDETEFEQGHSPRKRQEQYDSEEFEEELSD